MSNVDRFHCTTDWHISN